MRIGCTFFFFIVTSLVGIVLVVVDLSAVHDLPWLAPAIGIALFSGWIMGLLELSLKADEIRDH